MLFTRKILCDVYIIYHEYHCDGVLENPYDARLCNNYQKGRGAENEPHIEKYYVTDFTYAIEMA